MQIQQRQDLADLGAPAAPGRQDRAGEAGLVAGDRVQPAVVDPGAATGIGPAPVAMVRSRAWPLRRTSR